MRDDPADVALSDGSGAYVSDFSATVRDFSPSQPDGDYETVDQDQLSFSLPLGAARFTRFNNSFASAHHGPGSTEPIRCNASHFFFVSPSTPDFVEALQTVGASVTGFASAGCRMSKDFKYQANYEAGNDDCVSLTRSSESTLTLTAPPFDATTAPQCLATINTYGSSGDLILGSGSAPFEVTFAISAPGPGNGNGRGGGTR